MSVTPISLIADVQHEIWSHWMRYVFDLFDENDDGSVTISAEKVLQWKRQTETRYKDLSWNEKQGDDNEALMVIHALEKEHVIVSKEYLEELQEQGEKLMALEGAGVDNWEWYDDAMEAVWEKSE